MQCFFCFAKAYTKQMVRLLQICTLISMLVSNGVAASPQSLNVVSIASNHGTLVLGRSTGIPGMLAVSQLFGVVKFWGC